LKETSFLKEKSFSQNSWNIQISREDKDQIIKNYLNLIKRILSNNWNSQYTVIYTDRFKIQNNVNAEIIYMYERNNDEKFWNLKNSLKVFNAELFAIFQALKWTQSFNLEKIKEI